MRCKNCKNLLGRFLFVAILPLSFLFLSVSPLKAATLKEDKWEQGQTLLSFFEKNSIPLKIYYDLPREDKELADEIMSGSTFYTLYEGDKLLQALIPINENSQLHIYQKDGKYGLRAIPTIYFSEEKTIALVVETSLYNDIVKYTGDNLLASDFIQAYKYSVNFKQHIKKNDKLAIIYERKYRLGKLFGSPNIKASILETNRKEKYVIRHRDGHLYDLKGNQLHSYLLTTPLNYKRISSNFSMGRKHPILGFTRPHLGVDYAAPYHTPVKASGKGKVIFAGVKGGYGNTVIIQHNDGYKTLYAHLHKIAKGIRSGIQVPQGKVIGVVGSTGLSTGPHLHFGLYRNGNAVNPLRYLKFAKTQLNKKEKEFFLPLANEYKIKLDKAISQNIENEPFRKRKESHIVYLDNPNNNL